MIVAGLQRTTNGMFMVTTPNSLDSRVPSATLPDAKYVLAIRAALWSRGDGGRAAVMVGAGFSRNADAAVARPRPILLWHDLLGGLLDQLDPATGADEERRKEALLSRGSVGGALRLAEEYEAAFGRHQLEEYLLRAIPDGDYRPGTLHELLLQLPWQDVLTTNYDTLLERAARTSVRRYELVETAAEIPAASRPRVVKLHGSFPAHRPFIFTEEDFRVYPRRFATFVNLAQQVIAENTLCLLGFSGDDPNFLYWTGWVRDHLGSHTPTIYLCAVLNQPDAERRVLARRNVIPVDLGPLFPSDRFPDRNHRHRVATEWFLRSLKNGRPFDPVTWPQSSRPSAVWDPALPPLIEPSGPLPKAEARSS
jgi:hypothetical protein